MNFAGLLRAKGVRFKDQGQGNYALCCVFCRESRYRLGVSLSKRAYNCFNCPAHGRLGQLLRYLGHTTAIDNQYAAAHTQAVVIDLPKGFEWLKDVEPDDYGMPAIAAYAQRRGVTADQIDRWKIGGTIEGKAAYRLVMPVFADTKLYNWSARAIYTQEPKYLMEKGGTRALWGELKHTTVIAEGILKALAMERAFSDYGVASCLGNFLTEFQVEQLDAANVGRVIIYPDPLSSASVSGLLKSGELLQSAGIECWYPVNFPDQQADEYNSAEEVLEPLQHLVQYSHLQSMRLKMELARL